MQMKRLSPC